QAYVNRPFHEGQGDFLEWNRMAFVYFGQESCILHGNFSSRRLPCILRKLVFISHIRKGSTIRGTSTMPAEWDWLPAFAEKKATPSSARASKCSSTSLIAARRAAIRRRATARAF